MQCTLDGTWSSEGSGGYEQGICMFSGVALEVKTPVPLPPDTALPMADCHGKTEGGENYTLQHLVDDAVVLGKDRDAVLVKASFAVCRL